MDLIDAETFLWFYCTSPSTEARPIMQRTSKLRQLVVRLLTTTCLTAAASVACYASTVTEPSGGFSGSLPGTLLPIGTDQVNGTTDLANGIADVFELQGLPAGLSLTAISLRYVNNSLFNSVAIELWNDDGADVVTPTQIVAANSTYNPIGIIPSNGDLVVEMFPSSEGGSPYVLTLNLVPEPGTFTALGLGLAGLGAAGLRRRLRKS